MFAKLENDDFLADVRPPLAADEAEKFDHEAGRAAFAAVFSSFIKRIPGKAWARTAEMAGRELSVPFIGFGQMRGAIRRHAVRA